MSEETPFLMAICTSEGGVPKHPVREAVAEKRGLVGDGRGHAKHEREDRAVSLLDWEELTYLREKGYNLAPGTIGENMTVKGLEVQKLKPGTRLLFSGGVELLITMERTPCFVLDVVDEQLKGDCVGHCGALAAVAKEGTVVVGETIRVEPPA